MDKAIVEDHKEEFKGDGLVADALAKLVSKNRDDAIEAVADLFRKEYQTLAQVDKVTKELEKANSSLAKTRDKIAKVKAGDLSVLFNSNKPEDKETGDN